MIRTDHAPRFGLPDLTLRLGAPLVTVICGLGIGFLVSYMRLHVDYLLVVGLAASSLWLLGFRRARGTFDLFDPLTVFLVAMGFFLVMRPLALLIADDFDWRGYDTADGFRKGMVVGIIGVGAFVLGYQMSPVRWLRGRVAPLPDTLGSGLLFVAGVALAVVGLLGLAVFFSQSGGTASDLVAFTRPTFDDATRQSVGYIYNAPLLSLPASLIAVELWRRGGHDRALLVLAISLPSLLYFAGQADRLFLLAIIGQPIMYRYLIRGSRPNLLLAAALLPVVFIMISAIRDARNDSDDVGISESAQAVFDDPGSAWTDFTLGADSEAGEGLMFLVTFVPQEIDFAPGATIQNLVTQAVPRALWPTKPRIPEEQIMDAAFPDAYLRTRAGATFTAMGTFYFDSGIAGVIVGMALSGVTLRFLWVWMQPEGRFLDAAIASSLPLLAFLFARASLPAAAVIGVWTLLPFFGLATVTRMQRTA